MNMMNIYVVPSLKAKDDLIRQSQSWAAEIGAAWIPRQGQTMDALQQTYGDNLLIYTSKGPQLVRAEGTHFFSLNMAQLRIQQIRRGQTDHFLEAIGTAEAITLLDCTCGFGADTITAAFALPSGSRIDALEISPLLGAVTQWGVRHFVHEKDDVTQALRRIHLTIGDFRTYLQDTSASPYDVLYFDPMFQRPVKESCQFQPVRPIMDHDALSIDDVRLALQKARRRVVIKDRNLQWLAEAFPQMKRYGGRYSRVAYGVLNGEAT